MTHDSQINSAEALELLDTAARDGKLSPGAVENIRCWLTQSRYAKYAPEVLRHMQEGMWKQLDDVFFTIIPFGTGGRRGMMYPIGSNAINDRTIGESAQGLAEYVKANQTGELSCAIAYDTRHNSRHFAELCAGIMVANGFKVYFLDGYRSTPALSFTVRQKKCSCGIMVTASHNPPSDNAVKVYWSTGGQVMPPHDKAIIARVMDAGEIAETPFADAVAQRRVEFCTAEIDSAFTANLKGQSLGGPRAVKIIYSPLHGVGEGAVCPALEADGFADVEVFEPHREPSGDFPNVPGHVSNPENRAVFDSIIERAKQIGADVILATDPDCDRLGIAAPTTSGGDEWRTFSGNQIAVLLCDYVLEQRGRAGALSPDHYVVTTLVTTKMIRRIAESYNVRTEDNLLVGFKWIAGKMDECGADKFVFGCEESHGYLVGQYARDKDGAVAAMLAAEMTAKAKSDGQSLHEKLDSLYWQHGYHAEDLQNVMMPGSEGMARMKALMQALRSSPPKSLGGMNVVRIRDYENSVSLDPAGNSQPLDGPVGDVVILDLATEGNYVAIRPSGTEPKAKFYIFTFTPAEMLHDLDATKAETAERIAQIRADVQAYADAV